MAKQNPTTNATTKPTRGATKPANEAEAPKEPRVDNRVAFVESDEAAEIRNADGKLTAAPGERFDHKKHKAPKRGDFHDEADYAEYKAAMYEEHAERFTRRAKTLRENITLMRKIGDPAQRAVLQRRMRLQEQMAELDAQLAADGINVDDYVQEDESGD